MKTSASGIALIEEFEGLRLKAYPDPGTGGKPFTIGFGHTGPEVRLGMVITRAQAEAYLRADLARFEAAVDRAVVVALSQNEFDALVSFSYNVGEGNLRSSTLLKKLNAGDRVAAANEFSKWNKAAGKVLPGLTRRRAAEAALFATSDAPDRVPAPAPAPAPVPASPAPGGFLAALMAALLAAIRKA